MSRLKAGLLALLSGTLVALCLPRPGLCELGWIGLAPLAGLTFRRSPKSSAGLGFLAGFAYFGIILYWVYSTCRYARIPDPSAPHFLQIGVAVGAWAALAGFLALDWALSAALCSWVCARAPSTLKPWAWAVTWTAVTVAAERWTPRFAVDLLGYTQWRHLSLLQMSAVFGPHGLGFIVAAANAAVAAAWLELENKESSAAAAANMAAVTLMAVSIYAYGKICLSSRTDSKDELRVEILQPNIDQYQKFDEGSVGAIRENFDELLSRPRLRNPDLVVWPESAVPYWIDEGQVPAETAAWSKRLSAEQIVGVVSRDHAGGYNATYLIGADGSFKSSYHKRQLVPFGEFVPLKFLDRYISILSEMNGLTPGAREQPLMETPLGPTAATICYEATFPRWYNLDARRGARVVVNVTNDGWYKMTWGPYQHMIINVFRAVEDRVTVIRSGNTGISAVIDPWGVVTAELPLGERGRLDAGVPREDFFPGRSFYARRGDWFGTLILWLAAFWLGFAFWRKPRES